MGSQSSRFLNLHLQEEKEKSQSSENGPFAIQGESATCPHSLKIENEETPPGALRHLLSCFLFLRSGRHGLPLRRNREICFKLVLKAIHVLLYTDSMAPFQTNSMDIADQENSDCTAIAKIQNSTPFRQPTLQGSVILPFGLQFHRAYAVLANMENQEQSSGSGLSVKESIKYLCDLITGLGVTGMTPETLRLAKFNKLESHQSLLRTLHDIVTLSTPNKPSPQTNPAIPKSQKQQGKELKPLERTWEELSDEEVLGFVKFHLALWGYPPHSPFFTLHVDAHGSSRHYLLALGWMVSYCGLIERGLERRLQPLLAARSAAPLPDDYPLDMADSSEAVVRARNAERAARDFVRRMVVATDRVEEEDLQTEMRVDQVLVLYGQVTASLNAIEALQQSKVKKLHELELAQLAAGVKHPHSPYELQLLQHRKQLDVHCEAIAAAKAIEKETELCRKHEALFWQWMESVAHEELSRPSAVQHLDLTGVTEAELLPAIEHLKHTLATCEQSNETIASSSCRNSPIPKDPDITISESFKRNVSLVDAYPREKSMLPKEIAEVLLRPPVFVYRPRKRPDTRTIKATLRNEEGNDPQTALFKMKRLMEVDEMVKGILARTRAENKAVIMEIMKPIVEDESYVVVGL